MKNLFYRVKKDEDLLSISERFSVPPTVISNDNKLKKEPEEGDILFIRKVEGIIYKINPEDSIFLIAEKFGTTEERILEKNKTPYVVAGETIII